MQERRPPARLIGRRIANGNLDSDRQKAVLRIYTTTAQFRWIEDVSSDGSLTVTVPIRIKRRGLRKAVTLPNGGYIALRSWDTTPTPLQLALARGHRWLTLLESGEARSLKAIARREGLDDSYARRMVNLATLAPDIVAAILDETLPAEVTLFELAAGTPLLWAEQRKKLTGGLMRRDQSDIVLRDDSVNAR